MALSLRHVHGLGFKTETVSKKDSKVILLPSVNDWHCKLILAYYSMSLIPAFLLEGCLANLIKNAVITGNHQIGKLGELNPIFKALRMYADLFQNEGFVETRVD